jgi:hypothetical protein
MPPDHADGEPVLRVSEKDLRPERVNWKRKSPGLPGLGLLPPVP